MTATLFARSSTQEHECITVTDEQLENNRAYAADFSGPLHFHPASTSPSSRLDARLRCLRHSRPRSAEAHVVRNAAV